MVLRRFYFFIKPSLTQEKISNVLKTRKLPLKGFYEVLCSQNTPIKHYNFLSIFLDSFIMRYKTHKTIDFTQLSTQKLVENDRARNINTLDRSLFDCVIKVIGIFVPESKVSDFRKKYKKQILRIPNVKPVLDVAADDTFHKGDHSFFKMVLLNPSSFIDLQQLYHTFEESSFTIPRDNFQQVSLSPLPPSSTSTHTHKHIG